MANYIRYANQGATRNDPLSNRLVNALSFLPDLGVTMEVFSGGQEAEGEGGARTGSVRHDHGDAADVFFYKDGRKLDWANPEDRPIFEEIVRRGKARGISGFGAGPGYMQAGSMHIGFGTPAVWGAGGKGANAPDWLRAAYSGVALGDAPQVASIDGGTDTLVGASGEDTIGGAGGAMSAADMARMLLQGLPQQKEEQKPNAADFLSEQAAAQEQSAADMARMLLQEPVKLSGSAGALDQIAAQPSPMMPTPFENYTPQDRGAGFDITREVTAPSRELLSATGQSIMGQGPSVAGQMLPEGMPGREQVGRWLDVGLAPLAAAGLGYSGLVGAGADIAQAAGMQSAPRLASDLMAMPDAFAGTPGTVAAKGMPKLPREAATPATRIQPPPLAKAAPQRPNVAIGAAPKAMPSAVPEPFQGRAEIGRMAYAASKGDKKARERMAALVQVDPEAAAAAERLGLEFPADALGDNFQLREVTQAMRIATGTEMAEDWAATVTNAGQRANEVLRSQSAIPVADAADEIRTSLETSISKIGAGASRLYDRAYAQMTPGAQLHPSNSVKALNDFLKDRTASQSLKGANKDLYDLVTNPDGLTYMDMRDFKTELGKARNGQGQFKDASDAMVNAVYAAVSRDLEDFALANGGPEAADMVKAANKMWSEKKTLEENFVSAFGKNGETSVSRLITSAVVSGSKGDIGNLTKLMRVVPKQLRRSAILSGIQDASTAKGQTGDMFSFANFDNVWGGMKKQAPVMAMVRAEIGAETFNMLDDLYKVSRKTRGMIGNIAAKKMTGASVNADTVVREAFIDGILARFLNSSAGMPVKTAVGAGVGSLGGPLGAATGAAAASAIKIGGKRAAVAGELFRDPAFQRMAMEAARKGQVSPRTQQAVLQSPRFKTWAKTNDIADPETWLLGVISGQQATQTEGATNGR